MVGSGDETEGGGGSGGERWRWYNKDGSGGGRWLRRTAKSSRFTLTNNNAVGRTMAAVDGNATMVMVAGVMGEGTRRRGGA